MRFVQGEGVWHLVDEHAPADACIIATLRSEVEVLALSEFCRRYLHRADEVPEHFPVTYRGVTYLVTPLGAPGEKLELAIRGGGHSSTVKTEFAMPGEEELG
jgi:hypothetical protein